MLDERKKNKQDINTNKNPEQNLNESEKLKSALYSWK